MLAWYRSSSFERHKQRRRDESRGGRDGNDERSAPQDAPKADPPSQENGESSRGENDLGTDI